MVVNLEYFQVMERLPRSKGVTCFAVDWQTLRSGGKGAYLRICVAAKKKLLFFVLKDRSFITLQVCVCVCVCVRACVHACFKFLFVFYSQSFHFLILQLG